MNFNILCVIIHFGDESLTCACIESVAKDNIDIVVVDNDPKQNFNSKGLQYKKVKIFKTGGSDGFALANNRGVLAERKNYHDAVLFLNNDTIVKESAIAMLYELLQKEKVGIVGPCMPFLDFPQKIWACGGYVDKIRVKVGGLQKIRDGKPFEVDYLPGAAILCSLPVWDKIGGFPEKYFLAYEEAELALRVRNKGYKVMINPNAIILHKVGMSSEVKPKFFYNDIRNRIKFGRFLWGKIIGTVLAVSVTLITTIKENYKISLWLRAVVDEISGSPLNQAALNAIDKKEDNS